MKPTRIVVPPLESHGPVADVEDEDPVTVIEAEVPEDTEGPAESEAEKSVAETVVETSAEPSTDAPAEPPAAKESEE